MRTSISILAAALALAACAESPTGTSTAALQSSDVDAVQSESPKYVPHRIDLKVGQSTIVPGGRCGAGMPIVTVLGEGTGTATHLGKVTVQSSHCQNLADPTAGLYDGLITVTGADGSVTEGTYSGYFLPTDVPGVLQVIGTWVGTNGTRRFEGASGGGDILGTLNQVTFETIWTATGTISSVGSIK